MNKCETKNPYNGTVKAGLQRIRQELKAAGYTMGRTEGRYHPFANTQKHYPGLEAHRVGCSRWISVYFFAHPGVFESDEARVERKRVEAEARQLLRDKGLPLDDRGWMECRFYNSTDLR